LSKASWARTFLSAALLVGGYLFAAASFAAVGYQQVTVPDGDGKSLQAGIWYPSNTQGSAHALGMFTQEVALNGPVAGQGLPLILISHECAFIKNVHGDQLSPSTDTPVWIHDARIKAAVVATPAASYLFGPGDPSKVSVPIQLWRVENDSQAPDAWNGAVVRDNLKARPDSYLVQGADHFVFLAPCSEALAGVAAQICEDQAGFDRAAFHRAFNQSVVDFFTTMLRDR
jgi:predicted dienelactone hydrolase